MSVNTKNVKVVVLGDIGRSPRMQYQCMSLAKKGHIVDLIGYGETEPIEDVKEEPLLFYHYLVPCPQISIRLLNYVFKTIWQSLTLLFALFITRKADYVMVQNPPAIPTLLICWLYAKIVGAKYVIDWHNYAHTIMALNVGNENKLVKITKQVEAYFGRKADHHFCVSNAMKKNLHEQWGISAITLYDKPPSRFRTITLEEKHNLFKKLCTDYSKLGDVDKNSTAFTEVKDGVIALKENRPAILVSSTSWTEDEDFSVLFSSLQDYENHCLSGNEKRLPKLICIITGKGALKQYYCDRIAAEHWSFVTVITPWLEPEDYPLILGSADLGVCLHTSSSGLDLPMKVVDMFGCALPVCAYDFKSLSELVHHEKNGFVFKSREELSSQIQNWFEGFPNKTKQMKEIENILKTELTGFQNLRWDENWNNVASNVFV